MTMTWLDLYILFHPLIDILGTICLIALSAGSVLYLMYWILKRIWKGLVAVGMLSFSVFVLMAFLGV
jgi:hypothetical protein